MIKNLLNKLFGGNKNKEIELLKKQNEMLLNEIRKSNSKIVCNSQGLDKSNINKNLSVEAETCVTNDNLSSDIRGLDLSTINYSKASDEIKLKVKAMLKDELISSGVENVVETCEKFPIEILQAYCVTLMCKRDLYHSEDTNIESWSKERIIEMIDELNFLDFKDYMKEFKGIEIKEPSEAQIKKLKEIGVTKMPKTSMGASKLIEMVVGKQSNEPTKAQIDRIVKLTERLGYQGEELDYSTKYKASKVIEELQAKADEVLGAEPATKEQMRYYGQLLKACNKRLTQSRKEFAHSCTKKQISEAIEELKKELKELHPEVSEGQANYIISLHQMLMLPYNVDEIKKLTKEEGSNLIARLNRQYLYMETRRYQASLTMEDIDKMKDNEVKDMLNQIAKDKKDLKAV